MVLVRTFANVVSIAAVAALLVASAAPADAACAAAWVCSNVYAAGTQVSYNQVNYTLAYGPRGGTCPGWTPDLDNWWTNNGSCSGGATPTSTATATATATTGGATPTFTATATATTAGGGGANYQAAYWNTGCDPCIHNLPGGGGEEWIPMGACSGGGCWAVWASGATYNGGNQVSRDCGGAGATPTSTATATGAATATATNTNTATPTSGGSGIGAVISSSQYDTIWPPASRAATYAYGDFVTAGGFYPAVGGTGDTNTKKREVAAWFASKDQETGVGQYDRELYCQPGGGGYGTTPCNYCQGGSACGGCAAQYWGRHAVQLSWDFNYCLAQTQIPVTGVFADPNQIFSNKVTGWKTAYWYWSTQLGPYVSNGYGTWPSETAHDAITTTDGSGNYGFAGTIRAVNGAIECQSRVQQQINRVTYYNGTGTDEEDSSGGTLGVLGYTGGAFGRRFCSP